MLLLLPASLSLVASQHLRASAAETKQKVALAVGVDKAASLAVHTMPYPQKLLRRQERREKKESLAYAYAFPTTSLKCELDRIKSDVGLTELCRERVGDTMRCNKRKYFLELYSLPGR